MHDLTTGSIPKHILRLAAPLALGMVFQTLYYLVDLFFVARLGDVAIAGVSAAGNLQFVVLAMTQVLGVGTMVLISHAAGRKDRADANVVFNQSLLIAAVAAVFTLAGGYAVSGWYMGVIGADEATARAGLAYLHWFLPALGLQFALVAMGSALRGTGIAKPTMIVQMLSVLLNAVLAPILIAGWLTGRPLGVAGAGLASTIAVSASVLALLGYFVRHEKFVGWDTSLMRFDPAVWRRILRIGGPAGAEFAFMFVSMAVIYWIIADFGSAAQAGFGVGSRVMQAIFLPAMAIAFAAAPIAGQNIAAQKPERAREAFNKAVLMGSALMATLSVLCFWRPGLLVQVFSSDAAVAAVATEYLTIIAWTFVAGGFNFTCSGMFQAIGNTVPSLMSSAARVVMFVVPALWLSRLDGFGLRELWILSVFTGLLQAAFSYWLLLRVTPVFRAARAS
ncbi:MAG: MATE family efflux transporter [Gemmatimonadaceae bacterium]